MIDFKLPSYVEGMTGDKSLSKAVNRALLLELVKSNTSISRAELAKQSGLTKATVSSQISQLIDMGILKETGAGESDLGRKPVMLEIDAGAGYAIGISIMTESLHVIILNMSGDVVKDELIELDNTEPENVVNEIKSCIRSARRSYGKSNYGLVGVGLAIPGAMERDTEKVIRSAKLDWTNVTIVDELSSGFKGFIHAGNDATLSAIAERELYGSGEQDFICLMIDEGIGLGAYINGSIHYGYNGQFGEVGHMTIVHGGPRCPCGNYGCWDLFGSELALREALANKLDKRLITEQEAVALASDIPENCRGVFDEFIGYLTTGVLNVINSMAPSVLVINSSILSASTGLFDDLKRQVAERSMSHIPACELRLSLLGKAAPAIGAGIAVQRMFFKSLVLRED